jgi:iron-sulfur cluster insertion protein
MTDNVSENAGSGVETYIPEPIVFTDNAALKVAQLIDEEENHELKLRVFITGGGCSGFQYGFTFDEEQNEDDTVLKRDVALKKSDSDDEGGEGSTTIEVRVLVDPMSFQYLLGAEIDYKEDLNGAQFVIRNPNAKTTCGCGSSFSV